MPSSTALLRASPQFRANQQAGGRGAGSSFAVGGLRSRSCLPEHGCAQWAAGGRTLLASQVPVFSSQATLCSVCGLKLCVYRLCVCSAMCISPQECLRVPGTGL